MNTSASTLLAELAKGRRIVSNIRTGSVGTKVDRRWLHGW